MSAPSERVRRAAEAIHEEFGVEFVQRGLGLTKGVTDDDVDIAQKVLEASGYPADLARALDALRWALDYIEHLATEWLMSDGSFAAQERARAVLVDLTAETTTDV